MDIFISHSSKDAKTAVTLSNLLEGLNYQVNTFCSSEDTDIPIGEDYIEYINDKIDTCDFFIALLSDNYMTSKYCLIELGFIYSKCVLGKKKGIIKPFTLPGYTQQFKNTPLHNYQCYELLNKNQLHAFIGQIRKRLQSEDSLATIEHIDYDSFANKVNIYALSNLDVLSHAEVIGCCSNPDIGDMVKCALDKDTNTITLSYTFDTINMFPSFISAVIDFYANYNLIRLHDIKHNLCLRFSVINFTNSIRQLQVEFQTSTNNVIGHPFLIDLPSKDKVDVEIPISKYSNYVDDLSALRHICFVILDKSFDEYEGTIIIEDVHLS